MGLILAWGIWIYLNKDEDIVGCPICGSLKTTQSMFFFAAAYVGWWVIGVPIKIASAVNFVKYYNLRYSGGERSYSLGTLLDKDALTLVVLK